MTTNTERRGELNPQQTQKRPYGWRMNVKFNAIESRSSGREIGVTHKVVTKLTFKDRLRILFGSNVITISHMHAEHDPGRIQADDVVTIISPHKEDQLW